VAAASRGCAISYQRAQIDMGHDELPILVTGAAGRIGSVGRKVTELLLARGLRVRAHVRVDDERAASLRALGAETVVGDLLDLMAVHRAIEGCERMYFGMSVSPDYLEAAANVAIVARHHGVMAFVNLSQMTVKEMDIFNTTASPQQKQHWLAETSSRGRGCQWWKYAPRPSWKGFSCRAQGAWRCRTGCSRRSAKARTRRLQQSMWRASSPRC
jgi:NADPH:quinone reductase-like Zn-dependent oxidoreductase